MKLNKSQITQRAAERAGVSHSTAAKVLDAVLEELVLSLEDGHRVLFSNFGTFAVSRRRAFQGHNPATGAEILIGERHIPVFRAGLGLKKRLNGDGAGEADSDG